MAGHWALRDDRQTLTWEELDGLVDGLVRSLLAADLGPERRIAVFAENSVEVAAVQLAALRAGCSLVPANFHLTAAEVAYILSDSGARLVFVGPETAGRGLAAASAANATSAPRHGLAVVGWRCPAPVRSWTEPSGGGSPLAPPVAPRPPLVYTSGTTGVPKGTELSPATFPRTATVAEHLDLVGASALAQHGPHLVVGPMYHIGPMAGAGRALGGRQPVVILGAFDAEATLAAIEEHRVAGAVMVPTHFVRLLRLPAEVRAKYDTSSLRYVLHTGASCPVAVKQQMIEWWGPVLVEVYGASEAGTTCSIDSAEWLAHPGSVGRCVSPFEALVVDDEGRPLPAGTEGRLYFRDGSGRGVVYHNDPVKSAAAHLAPGVFTLGEIGLVDADGFVYITDRFSDMVVSGGVNIYPAEAEQVLIEHPGVADVACIGLPDPEMGERLASLVVPADPSDPPAADELIAWCRARLAGEKCPRSVEVVESVGRTPLGKLNKRALRDWYLHRTTEVVG